MALRYLALGDSYTIGEGVAPHARWTHGLARVLRADGIAIDDPLTIAATGWTTDELATAIDAAQPRGPFDFASLLIGVNDQYRGRDVAGYRDGFSALLDRAIAFVDGRTDRVLVLSIPDWGVTPFAAESGRDLAGIARELDVYNTAARAICDARGVAFVDICPISRERGAEPAMLADDGLHPAAPMHAEWTRLALPAARHLLQRHARTP
ncbi:MULTISPECIES: SGNH/GDSL hydrolase family protein [unclassified Luteimonas]|uniref:SGNH/GDSL hydrolase family protein n=1 Tax=unclassified Luteimonas TaxID=2629088 RepID=UPI001603C0DA|nr:SGNH/GDSL hydrolase family protein [Luteimonas sp. MC1825]MBB1473033.1 SGNH/GDSL hydrolase family protein [Luteimonas sp. MC1782]MBB6598266.1 SGNH/GDSL hydrolase family protein [Luteimonas sp. MC1825]QOC88480.1 SGNH/GDSL hydrolase family protein [Luteimonas sp. MC1825]